MSSPSPLFSAPNRTFPANAHGPIGVFDSGFGGLTILKELVRQLPQYDVLYFGDNARAPYGPRSFKTVTQYTREAVEWLFAAGCPLVVLACNTVSARALRPLQQEVLPLIASDRRILGILRPTTEEASALTRNGHLGILGTEGTVRSRSYEIEIARFAPQVKVTSLACPIWVPLVESGESFSEGASWFVHRDVTELMRMDPEIDAVLLACTHYPLLLPAVEASLPTGVRVISQGPLVARKLRDYLQSHPEMEQRLTRGGSLQLFSSEPTEEFVPRASQIWGAPLHAEQVELGNPPKAP